MKGALCTIASSAFLLLAAELSECAFPLKNGLDDMRRAEPSVSRHRLLFDDRKNVNILLDVGGRPLVFALTTSATLCELATGSIPNEKSGRIVRLIFGGVSANTLIVDRRSLTLKYGKVDGVLGNSFFRNCAVGFDFTDLDHGFCIWPERLTAEIAKGWIDSLQESVKNVPLDYTQDRFYLRVFAGKKSFRPLLSIWSDSPLSRFPLSPPPRHWIRSPVYPTHSPPSDGADPAYISTDIVISGNRYNYRNVSISDPTGVGSVRLYFFGSERLIFDGMHGELYIERPSSNWGLVKSAIASLTYNSSYFKGNRLFTEISNSDGRTAVVEVLAFDDTPLENLLQGWSTSNQAEKNVKAINGFLGKGKQMTVLYQGEPMKVTIN